MARQPNVPDPQRLVAHFGQAHDRALRVLAPGEPLVVATWCSRGFVDYTTDHAALAAETLRPSRILLDALGMEGGSDDDRHRIPVNPSSGGPPGALGPSLEAALPSGSKHAVIAVTPTRLLVVNQEPPPKAAPREQIQSIIRSIAREARELVTNRTEPRPLRPPMVRWACHRGDLVSATIDRPSQAGFLRTLLTFRDGSWCVVGPLGQIGNQTPPALRQVCLDHQQRLVLALSPR